MRGRGVVALCGVVVVAAAAGWLGWRVVQVRHVAHQIQSTGPAYATALRHGNTERARGLAEELSSEVDTAYTATHDPLWLLAGAVPVLGDPFTTSARLCALGRTLTREVLPVLQPAVLDLTSSPVLHDGRVDVVRIAALGPRLDRAAAVLGPAADDARDLPRHLLPAALWRARERVDADLPSAAKTLREAADVVRTAPALLGEDGPRRYFVAVQNNAESRATGGLIGGFAVITADHGKITRDRVGTDAELTSTRDDVIDLGPEFSRHYGPDGGQSQWFSAGLTPDWPSSARVLRALWAAQGGGTVDGVIGVDPVALADLLKATGPVPAAGRTISADNVVDFVERAEYSEFAGREGDERKLVLSQIAAGLFDGILKGTGDPASLVRQVATAGSSGHLQIWSSHPDEQAVIAPLRAGGALPARPGGFLEVVTQNAAGSKADYYVHRTVAYQPRSGGRGRVTITLHNTVDPGTAAPYALLRLDDPTAPKGSVRLFLTVYGAVGGTVTLHGAEAPYSTEKTGVERGHAWAAGQVDLAAGKDLVLTADLTGMNGPLVYRQQPLVRDDVLRVSGPYSLG